MVENRPSLWIAAYKIINARLSPEAYHFSFKNLGWATTNTIVMNANNHDYYDYDYDYDCYGYCYGYDDYGYDYGYGYC